MRQILSVIVAITLTTMLTSSLVTTILQSVRDAQAQKPQTVVDHSKFVSHFATSGNNVYVVWWSNKTGNSDIMFRASTDNGKTFGDKINLSNTPGTQSYHPEIVASGDSVLVSWWEQPNQNLANHTAVMKVSNDNGKTFGPMLKLAANGTIGS